MSHEVLALRNRAVMSIVSQNMLVSIFLILLMSLSILHSLRFTHYSLLFVLTHDHTKQAQPSLQQSAQRVEEHKDHADREL